MIRSETKVLVWFRNDLRLNDHAPLLEAVQKFQTTIPVYIFDPELFEHHTLSQRRTGDFRLKFLIESVKALQKSLQEKGSDLLIRIGKADELIPELAQQFQAKHLHFHEESAPEERELEKRVEANCLKQGISYDSWWNATLCSKRDLPFSIPNLPDVFTKFRVQVERNMNVDAPLPAPAAMPALPASAQLALQQNTYPTLPNCTADDRGVMPFEGGEKAALAHVHKYIWENQYLKSYEETRNGLIGDSYSSKCSPWLALGCISPRFLFSEIRRFEHEIVKNKSTYWLIFELLWRDYFRFAMFKYGARFFQLGGIRGVSPSVQPDEQRFEAWRLGQTGVPFIDANMRELLLTGFMSNRGRQNVASFFVHALQLDWRKGAAWFEHQLIDYDPCSNWCNWAYLAGVGNDARKDRFFNPATQSEHYDPHGDYIKLWCPELAHVPHRYLHRLFAYADDTLKTFDVELGVNYPRPIVSFSALQHLH